MNNIFELLDPIDGYINYHRSQILESENPDVHEEHLKILANNRRIVESIVSVIKTVIRELEVLNNQYPGVFDEERRKFLLNLIAHAAHSNFDLQKNEMIPVWPSR